MSQAAVSDFVQHIKALGFRVFVAQRGDYGFITDAAGMRVLTFSFYGFDPTLSGCYGPPSRESGTGWRMDRAPRDLLTTEDVRAALYAQPPAFCGKGWHYVSTLAQYLTAYDASSRFSEVIS